MRNPVYKYNFQTSQALTDAQIQWLNKQLIEYLPTENEFEDIPEWTSEILLESVEEHVD